MIKPVLSMLGILVLMCLFFVGTYWATKLFAGRYQGKNTLSGTIQIISKYPLGKDQSLLIAKVAKRCLLLGVTQQTISLVCELEESSLPDPPAMNPAAANLDFLTVLKNTLKHEKPSGNGGEDK